MTHRGDSYLAVESPSLETEQLGMRLPRRRCQCCPLAQTPPPLYQAPPLSKGGSRRPTRAAAASLAQTPPPLAQTPPHSRRRGPTRTDAAPTRTDAAPLAQTPPTRADAATLAQTPAPLAQTPPHSHRRRPRAGAVLAQTLPASRRCPLADASIVECVRRPHLAAASRHRLRKEADATISQPPRHTSLV